MIARAQPYRVLIIEDNLRLQKLLRTLLEHEGFTVEHAADAAAALASVERRAPDLILQDLGLPDVDGIELVYRFRGKPSLDDVPIIAMSGMQSKLDLARTLQAGFTDYLVKPLESSRILELIRTYLPSSSPRVPAIGLGRRVLVVDQDPLQLKLARKHLEPLGFKVIEARSCAQALELAKVASPDAIVSTAIMPEPDGFKLCEAIRGQPETAHIPIILLSALLLEQHDEELAVAVGADALVPLSSDYREAVRVLTNVLGAPRKSGQRQGNKVSSGLSRRIFDRAERLAKLNAEFVRRLTLRDIELSVLGTCAAQIMDSNVRTIPNDLFEQCLSAAGILKAALFIRNNKSFELSTNYGFPSDDQMRDFFGCTELLDTSIDSKQLLRLDKAFGGTGAQHEVLESIAAEVAVIAPLYLGDEPLGALVAVPAPSLADDLDGFVSALASQVSVAIGLVRSMHDVRAAEKKLKLIFESVSEGLLFVDPDFKVGLINAAAAAIAGEPAEMLMGMHAPPAGWKFFRIDGTPMPAEEDVLQVAIRTGRRVPRREFVIQTSTRARIVVSASAMPVYDDSDVLLGIVLSISDISKQKRAQERLTYIAAHDALTDLPNRLMLNDRLAQALARARRRRNRMAIIFLDLDGFKNINDTFGHSVGDEVLVVLASRLAVCLRNDDTVARTGGDEFVISLSDVNAVEDVTGTVDRIMTACAQPFEVGDHEVSLTSSVGISVFPFDGDNVETLLRNADTAMYQAKGAGRDCFRFFTQSMHADAVEHLRLESDLRRAVEREEFCLVYQPIVKAGTRAIVSIEALLRWKHPTRGLLKPASFMRIAEDTGLIIPIGGWVLRKACMAMCKLQREVPTDVGISVNLSARQFQHKSLLSEIRELVPVTGLDPTKLTFEITETAAMADPPRTVEILSEIRAMGASVSIDDFGTGYSSLAYLQQLHASELKLDQNFSREIGRGSESGKIVRAVIALGRSLGMSVVAEGVETAEQATFLEANACHRMQGYYFTEPLRYEPLRRLMRKWAPRVRARSGHRKVSSV